MEKNLVRLLKADEIECRVSVINEKGLSLLLYMKCYTKVVTGVANGI